MQYLGGILVGFRLIGFLLSAALHVHVFPSHFVSPSSPQPASTTLAVYAQQLTPPSQNFAWVPFSSASDINYRYYQQNGSVVFSEAGATGTIPTADPGKLQVAKDLSTGLLTPYSKDESHVFYASESDGEGGAYSFAIHDADPATFQVLYAGPPPSGWPQYAKDNVHVYLLGFILSAAHPNTFAVLEPPPSWYTAYYSKDATHVFYGSDVVIGADPSTFSVFGTQQHAGTETYDAKDGDHLYLYGRQLQ
jgi:hypothetical protein